MVLPLSSPWQLRQVFLPVFQTRAGAHRAPRRTHLKLSKVPSVPACPSLCQLDSLYQPGRQHSGGGQNSVRPSTLAVGASTLTRFKWVRLLLLSVRKLGQSAACTSVEINIVTSPCCHLSMKIGQVPCCIAQVHLMPRETKRFRSVPTSGTEVHRLTAHSATV